MVPSATASSSISSFPLEVDDELITTQGAFSQPPNKVSTMTGFVAMVKLHIITGEALTRRRFSTAGIALSPSNELSASMQWIASAEHRIDDIQAGLPYQLAPVQAWQPSSSEEERSLYGMQRANILITALAAKFLLVRDITIAHVAIILIAAVCKLYPSLITSKICSQATSQPSNGVMP
jgi:hypothetical protein